MVIYLLFLFWVNPYIQSYSITLTLFLKIFKPGSIVSEKNSNYYFITLNTLKSYLKD